MDKKLKTIEIAIILLSVLAVAVGTLVVIATTNKTDVSAEPTGSFYKLFFFVPLPLAGIIFAIYATSSKNKKAVASVTAEELQEMQKEEENPAEEENKRKFKPTLFSASVIASSAALFVLLVFGCLTFVCAPRYSHDTEYAKTVAEKAGVTLPGGFTVSTTVGSQYFEFSVSRQSGIKFASSEESKAFFKTVTDSAQGGNSDGSEIKWHSVKETTEINSAKVVLATLLHGNDETTYYCVWNATKEKFDLWHDYTEEEQLIFMRVDVQSGDMMMWEISTYKFAAEEEKKDDETAEDDKKTEDETTSDKKTETQTEDGE